MFWLLACFLLYVEFNNYIFLCSEYKGSDEDEKRDKVQDSQEKGEE